MITGTTTYKNLYDRFLDSTKNYCDFTLNGIKNLYYYHNQGVVEEIFRYKKYEFGNIGGDSINLLGFPDDALERIDTMYSSLNSKIESETSVLQTTLPQQTTKEDKLYVKKLLLDRLKSSWLEIRQNVTLFQIDLRDNQLSLSKVSDRINLVSNYYDGFISGTAASIVVPLVLDSTTTTNGVTGLTQSVGLINDKIDTFITTLKTNINLRYDDVLGNYEEYFFFFHKLLNYNILLKLDPFVNQKNAKQLLEFKNDNLFVDLLNSTNVNIGYKHTNNWFYVKSEYEKNIFSTLKPMFNYDVNKYSQYNLYNNTLNVTLDEIKGELPTEQLFGINFTESLTNVSLVSQFFKRTIVGTNNDSYNSKVVENISIT